MAGSMASFIVAAGVIGAVACGRAGGGSGGVDIPRPPGASAAPSSAALPKGGPLSVQGTPSSDRHVAIRVANPSARTISLKRPIVVERFDKGAWSRMPDVGDIWIRESCSDHGGVMFWAGGAEECVDLGPNTTIQIAPWLGTIGDAQCACEECGGAPPGRYRFVLKGCDGSVYAGEPFELGAPKRDG